MGSVCGQFRVTRAMMQDLTELLADFTTVAQLAWVTLVAGDIRIESLPAPHAPPTRLPVGQMAVYVFTYGQDVL